MCLAMAMANYPTKATLAQGERTVAACVNHAYTAIMSSTSLAYSVTAESTSIIISSSIITSSTNFSFISGNIISSSGIGSIGIGIITSSTSIISNFGTLIGSSVTLIDRMVCQMPGCNKSYSKFKSLVAHFQTNHEIPIQDIKDTWIYQEFLAEKREYQQTRALKGKDFSLAETVLVMMVQSCCVANTSSGISMHSNGTITIGSCGSLNGSIRSIITSSNDIISSSGIIGSIIIIIIISSSLGSSTITNSIGSLIIFIITISNTDTISSIGSSIISNSIGSMGSIIIISSSGIINNSISSVSISSSGINNSSSSSANTMADGSAMLMPSKEMSAQELGSIALAYKDNGEVDHYQAMCLQCNKQFGKNSIAAHMMKEHGLSKEEVQNCSV